MRLYELFDPVVKDIKTKHHDIGSPTNNSRNLNLMDREAGIGKYSKVNHDARDPHIVRKQSRHSRATRTDPYWPFVAEVIKSKISQGNPHLPRFYEVKTFRNKNGDMVKRAKMEKLLPIYEVEPELLHQLILDNFKLTPENAERLKNAPDNEELWAYEYGYLIRDLLYNPKSIKKGPLLDAMNFLLKIKKESWEFDLHHENFMFRRGPQGIQLVLTDPFAGDD